MIKLLIAVKKGKKPKYIFLPGSVCFVGFAEQDDSPEGWILRQTLKKIVESATVDAPTNFLVREAHTSSVQSFEQVR